MDGSRFGRPTVGLVLRWIAFTAAAVVGAVWGYGFGVQIGGGVPLGLVAAFNAAAFSVLMVGGVVQWLSRRLTARRGSR